MDKFNLYKIKQVYLYKKILTKLNDNDDFCENFTKAFLLARKTNQLADFHKFLIDNKLDNVFLKNSFDIMQMIDGEEKSNFSDFLRTVGLDCITKIYGDKVSGDIIKLIELKKFGFYDFYIMGVYLLEEYNEINAELLSKLIKLYSENSHVGIHRTGGWENAGEVISNDGLILSGHTSSGVFDQSEDSVEDIIDRNVSFCSGMGIMLLSTIKGGYYKNFSEKELVDIVIIAMNDFDESTVIINGKNLMLNPKNVYGYVKVDTKNECVAEIISNRNYYHQDKEEFIDNGRLSR